MSSNAHDRLPVPERAIANIKRLRVGMTVELTATVTEEVAPGSEPKTKYTATKVVIIGDDTS